MFAEGPHLGTVGGEIAYAVLDPRRLLTLAPATLDDCLGDCAQSLPAREVGGTLVNRPWELIDLNPAQIARDFAAAFDDFDLLITPTSPTVAFELGARAADPLAMYMSDYCTVPMSLAGIPAISIPAGTAEPDGGGPELPVGLQITGPAFSESLILDAAHAIEAAVGFDHRPKLPGSAS